MILRVSPIYEELPVLLHLHYDILQAGQNLYPTFVFALNLNLVVILNPHETVPMYPVSSFIWLAMCPIKYLHTSILPLK